MSVPVVQTVFGLRLRTAWRLDGVPAERGSGWDVDLAPATPRSMAHAATFIPSWQRRMYSPCATLPDGSYYIGWHGFFELLASPDRRRIVARKSAAAHPLAFQSFLVNAAVSLGAVALGCEPIHATAVATPAGAVAFAGGSGLGKSTLAGLFLRDGCRLVTDDLLLLRRGPGPTLIWPGPPRIKMFAAMARRLLGDAGRTRIRMAPTATKYVFPVAPERMAAGPQPLRAIYLVESRRRVGRPRPPQVLPLRPAEAFPALLSQCLNIVDVSPRRHRRQLEIFGRVASTVPVRRLRFARDSAGLGALHDAVWQDLRRIGGEV